MPTTIKAEFIVIAGIALTNTPKQQDSGHFCPLNGLFRFSVPMLVEAHVENFSVLLVQSIAKYNEIAHSVPLTDTARGPVMGLGFAPRIPLTAQQKYRMLQSQRASFGHS